MNSKSIKKKINLGNAVSMSSNVSKIDDNWAEFQDNNSPIHNEALSPLFYELEKHPGNIAYDRNGEEYNIVGKTLYKNHRAILSLSGEKFERTEFDTSNLMEYYDGHFYEALPIDSRGYITILKDSEFYKEVDIGLGFVILTMRLYHGDLFCLSKKGDQLYFDGWGKYIDVSNIALNGFDATKTFKTATFTDPKIFVKGAFASIVTKTGSIVRADELYYKNFWDYNGITTVETFTKVPMSVPTQGSIIYRYTNVLIKISKTTHSEQKFCNKVGDSYFNDEGVEVTFDKGYKPQQVSGDRYRYFEYFTEVKYSFDQSTSTSTSGNPFSSGNFYAFFEVNLENSTIEYPTTKWNFNLSQRVLDGPKWADPETYTLTLKSNFGFIDSTSLYSPKVRVEFSLDKWEVKTFNKVETHTTVTTGASETKKGSFCDKYLILEDGTNDIIFYGLKTGKLSSFANDWVGYDIKGKVVSASESGVNLTCSSYLNLTGDSYNNLSFCYSIQYGNWRMNVVRKVGDWTTFAETGKTITHIYDALSDFAVVGNGVKRGQVWDGTLYDFMTPNGSRKQKQETFSLLFNLGQPYGFSYNGILVCPWETVDDSVPHYTDDNYCFYRDVDTKKWIFIKKVEGTDFGMVEDRYLVLNTTSYWNCWDTLLNQKEHYASDWNHRLFYGKYLSQVLPTDTKNWVFANAHNVYPAYSQSGITSSYFPPLILEASVSNKNFIGLPQECESIELYEANGLSAEDVANTKLLTGSLIPKYYMTVKNGALLESETTKVVDPNLIFNNQKATYRLSSTTQWQRNPSIFAKWTYSGNNIDYFTDGKFGYQITYEKGSTMNTTPALVSNLSGDVYNLTSLFVIQSMPYAVIDGKLYSLSYLNGVYQGMDCVLNLKGMQYVGAVPSIAFFYSPMNRTLYSFTGDCNLTKVKDAGAINKIYGIWYNSSTQIIYMATDYGLFMIGDTSSYRQEFFDVQSVYFLEDGSSVVVNKEDGEFAAYHIHYDYKEGRLTNQVRLDTGLYGAGENKVFTVDKWSFSLFSEDKLNGSFKIRSYVLRDNGQIETEDKTFKVTTKDWDKEFKSLLINYTPKNNRGVGLGFKVLSDFAISDITASASVSQETQPARVNI